MGVGIQVLPPYPIKVEVFDKWHYGVAWHGLPQELSVKCVLCISDPKPFEGGYVSLGVVDKFRTCRVDKDLVRPMTQAEFKAFGYLIQSFVTTKELKQIIDSYQTDTEAHESSSI